jgi:hypothetical protein
MIQLQIFLCLESESVKSALYLGMSVDVFCELWERIQALLEKSGTSQ